MKQQWYKKYVDVVVFIDSYGAIRPLFVVVDSRKYQIDKVLEVRNAHSQVGGSGVRYRCRIQNQERNLFLERNRWFMESLQP